MRFQVPQFIEVEDKIFGPLTLKQFIYLAGGAGLAFVIYLLLGNIVFAAVPMIIVLAISGALAFYKVHSKPLIHVVEAAFKYWFGGKLYIWKKDNRPATSQSAGDIVKEAKNYAGVTVPKISDSKLKDLTWSLDIKESIYTNADQK